MTADLSTSIRASRLRVSRTRGALSGIVVMLLGLWAGLAAFIGPAFNLAYTPDPNTTWHWTAARGWLEVLPGAAAFLGGLILLVSTSRLFAGLGGWLAAIAGAWLIVGSPLAGVMNLNLGSPDPTSRPGVQAAAALLFFFATGAAIVFFASIAIGRLSVHSVRDVRVAERRAVAEEAAAAEERQRLLEEAEAERQAPPAYRPQGTDGSQPQGTDGSQPRGGPVAPGAPAQAGPMTEPPGRHAESAPPPQQYPATPYQERVTVPRQENAEPRPNEGRNA
jgi:hypothetical protein